MAYTSDILTGGTASANYEYLTWVAANAVDNNEATEWICNHAPSGGAPNIWTYDLGVGVTKKVRKFRLLNRIDNLAFVKDFKVQGSTDNFSGSIVDLTTQQAGETIATWQEWTFGNNTFYRYYRMYITSSWKTDTDLWEIEMMEEIEVDNAIFMGMNF